MKIPTLFVRTVLGACITAVAVSGGCAVAAGPPAVPASASAPPSARLVPPITALVGDAECVTQSQCHAIGIGAKACGGPSSYVAWSDKATDAAALRAAVQAHATAQVEENKASGLASNCSVSPEPTAVCRPRVSDGKKTCQLGQGGVRSVD